MSLRNWGYPAAGIAGLALGLMMSSMMGGRDATMEAPVGSRPTPTRGEPAALTVEDIRRVVREELAVARSGASQERHADAVAAPSTAQSAAATEARSVLEAAIARRSWDETDADAMREVFANLSGEQQAEFLRQYAMAVNQGRLVPNTERVPF